MAEKTPSLHPRDTRPSKDSILEEYKSLPTWWGFCTQCGMITEGKRDLPEPFIAKNGEKLRVFNNLQVRCPYCDQGIINLTRRRPRQEEYLGNE